MLRLTADERWHRIVSSDIYDKLALCQCVLPKSLSSDDGLNHEAVFWSSMVIGYKSLSILRISTTIIRFRVGSCADGGAAISAL